MRQKVVSPRQITVKPEIIDSILQEWQVVTNLVSEVCQVLSCLVMRQNIDTLEVISSSQQPGTPFKPGDKEVGGCGIYCETVISEQTSLHIPNALMDVGWAKNPEVNLGMISYFGVPVNWPDGQPFGTFCILDNKQKIASDQEKKLITAFSQVIETSLWRLTNEEKLRESEAQLLRVIENSPFGVSIVSQVTRARLYVNSRFLEMSGAGTDVDLLDLRIADSFVDPNKLEENWTTFVRDGVVSGSEEERRRVDGKIWWSLTDWRSLIFAGETAAMIWHYDISQRKSAEEDLRAQTKLINLLRKTASDANKATNFNEAIHSCLATVASFTNWPVGHIYTLSDEDENLLVPSGIWHLDDPKRFTNFVEATKQTTFKIGIGLPGRVLESGEPAWIVDVTKDPNFPRAKLAENIGVHAAFAFPVLAGEKVVAVLEFFDEEADEPNETLLATIIHIGNQLGRVFERKQSELALRRVMEEIDIANQELEMKVSARTQELNEAIDEAENARQLAEAANKTKTEFLANMSHELRTPLNAIIGFSEMIKGAMFGPLLERYQDYAKDINNSGEHLLGIISDILDLSKVEAGELEILEEEINMAETIISCKTMVSGRAEEAGVSLTSNVARDCPLLHADPLRLKQMLMNLLTNAIKFTPKGGQVTVSVGTSGKGGVVLVVKDTGIGIAKDDIPKVLEKFGQVRDGYTRAHEGAGLGLAITKALIEQHGGTLEIKSERGKGTSVTISFPPDRAKDPPEIQAE